MINHKKQGTLNFHLNELAESNLEGLRDIRRIRPQSATVQKIESLVLYCGVLPRYDTL